MANFMCYSGLLDKEVDVHFVCGNGYNMEDTSWSFAMEAIILGHSTQVIYSGDADPLIDFLPFEDQSAKTL